MTEQFCTFYLCDLFLGIPVEQVQEVIRYQEMTPVPLAPAQISGLMNLRGQIVTAVDLRRRMELPDRPATQRPMNVIVSADDGAVSLLVDEIGDVLEIDPRVKEHPPDTLKPSVKGLVTGVYKLEGRLLLALDARRLANESPGAGSSRERGTNPRAFGIVEAMA
jgi:purine-binding chemotaxis protein CheW